MRQPWLLLACGFCLGLGLWGQAPTWGTPQWRVNVPQPGSGAVYTANADGSFAIPLLQKSLRGGMPFSLNLSYNSDIYQNNGGFQPVSTGFSATPNWGWLTQSSAGTINFDVNQNNQCYYNYGGYGGGGTWISYPTMDDFRFYDASGTIHSFGITLDWTSNPCHTGTQLTGTAMSTDGEGYYMYASMASGTLVAYVKGPNGYTYNYYNNTTGSYVAEEDTNGNELTETLSSATNQTEVDYADSTGNTIVKQITYTGSTCPVHDPNNNLDPECIDYHVLEPGGGYQDYWLYFQSFSVNTASGCSGIADYSGTALLPVYLTLPQYSSGTNWLYSFAYNGQGAMSKITYPTGGDTAYSYGSLCTFGDGTPASIAATYDDGTNSGTTTFTRGSGTTTISRPDGSQEVVTYGSNGLPSDIKYYDTNGTTLLKEVELTDSNGYPATAVTYLGPSGGQVKVSETDTTYDSDGNLTQSTAIDWARDSSGATKSITNITYLGGSAYVSANILDKPTEIQVTNGAGTTRAQTVLGYDDYSSHYAMQSVTGLPNHDDANYGTGNTVRGNPTSIERFSSSSASLNTYLGYDSAGNIVGLTQPNGHKLTLTYGDCSDTYPSQVSVPGGNEDYSYDCYSGDLLSRTGPNNHTYGESYDAYGRLSSTSDPDGGGIQSVSYVDPNHTQTVVRISSGQTMVSQVVYDGLGRVIYRQTENPASAWDTVEAQYNLAGEVSGVSMPYSTSSSPSPGTQFTDYAYDGLGRKISMTLVDGSKTMYVWTDNAEKITDPLGHAKILEFGGLGHLWQVCEVSSQSGNAACNLPAAGSGFLTTYTYDMAGRLTQSDENGQKRNWSYDWLGRKLTSAQPESGTTDYIYDSVSNSICPGGGSSAPGQLVLIQNAASQAICLSYGSNWGRLSAKNLSTGQSYGYGYDSGTNGLGRLTSASAPSETMTFSYDAMGQIAGVGEDNNGINETTNYQYNELGEITALTAPTGRQFNYAYDAKARLTGIEDNSTGTYYLDRPSGAFNSADQIISQYLGGTTASSPLAMTAQYNNVGQLYDLKYLQSGGGGAEWQYQWGASVNSSGDVTSNDNNGTLREMIDVSDSTQDMTYTYDDMNRVATAVEGNGGNMDLTFSIDPLGNRNNQAASAGLNEYFPATASNNQISAFTYDAAGRLTAGNWDSDSRGFAWDAQGELETYTDANTGTTTYEYDPFGRRIESHNASSGKVMYYFYGAGDGGHPVAEYNGSNWQTNVLAGGQVIAMVTESNPVNLGGPSSVSYLALDLLGSTRMTQSSSFQSYYPYGQAANSAVSAEYMWTDQMRGANSGMDHFWFRGYNLTLGRWITPDPAGLASVNPANPQTWNRYAYVANDPLGLSDILGLATGGPVACVGWTQTNVSNGINGYCEGQAVIQQMENDNPNNNPVLQQCAQVGIYCGPPSGYGAPGGGGGVLGSLPNVPQAPTKLAPPPNHDCGGQAWVSFGAHAGLDILGAIPGVKIAQMFFSGSTSAIQAIQATQIGLSAVMAGADANSGDQMGAGLAFAGAAVSVAQSSTSLMAATGELLPGLSEGIAAASVVDDAYNSFNQYLNCSDSEAPW